ncbi:Hemolysin-type calcium-binding region [Sulfitobacter noctilucicola]|uniref:Ca2+-binding RTX toxin-like protein n=1 Tax=Sulfitobacter noctilucicola TaxID=1342301 RepID=A0A7W6MC78_9RHOB|nr:calcium-binding protein [Sulfitobacter noctilucicola]KIN69834.1 Hemolysin-type calcium-binding region [Sulfitobacter noctilucicola]MBB4176204.1 Ca2+-binding RTX toxin-like protein [Sulfitobacter noctilucicola]
MATTAQVEQVIKLFIGYFNRAPAPGGTNYWSGRFEASSEGPAMTWAEIAESFSVQSETTTLYPIMDTRDFSEASLKTFFNSVFQNLFGRDIRDGGLAYYSNQLTTDDPAEQRSVGEIILDIINGAVDGPDKARIDNKVAVSMDFFNKTDAIPGFVFDADARAVATSLLTGVTDDPATVDPALAQTSAYIATVDSGQPGVTINLTASADLPGGDGGGTDTAGTANNDTYAATVESFVGGTLQNSDVIEAGGGQDTLNIRAVATSQIVSPSATGLEKIAVTNQLASSSFILDMSGMEGETELAAIDTEATSATTFLNVDDGAQVRLVNVDGQTLVNFKGDRSASTTDAIDLFVSDSGTQAAPAVFATIDSSFAPDTSYEVATIETGGTSASFLDMSGMTLDTLTVTGTQQLQLDDNSNGFAALKSADASAMTGGGLFLFAPNNTSSDFAFMGSDFDDTLQLNNTLLNNANTLSLDGGGGTDMLVIDSFNTISAASVNATSGFEVLAAANTTSSLNAEDFNSIDQFLFGGQTGNDGRININGVTGDDTFIFASNVGRGDEAVRFQGATAGQSLQFELRGAAGTGGEVRIESSGNSSSSAAVGFSGNNISSAEIISSGANDAANVIRGVDSGSNNYFAFDNQNGPSNFSISGSQALTITAEAGVNLNASSDESGFSNGVNLDGSGASGVLRLAGSNSNDAIEGGSAADIFYGMGGSDVLTGNGGADQFRFSNNSGTDEIKDFTTGTDKIGLERVDFANTTQTAEGATLNTADYVDNLLTVANLSGADSNKVVELQNAATGAQITGTAVGATNTYLLVFNQTSGKGELWFDNDWSTTAGRSMTAELDNITTLSDLVGLSNTDFVEYMF